MALVAILFASRPANCRFAVVRRGDGWTLLWRSRAGATGRREISSAVADALDRATTGGHLHASTDGLRSPAELEKQCPQPPARRCRTKTVLP